MARIKRNYPVASGASAVLGHGSNIMRRISIGMSNNQTKYQTSFTRSTSDSVMFMEGAWTGGTTHSYSAGMFGRLVNASNSELVRRYGWGYFFGRDGSNDQNQHLFSCYNIFRASDIGTYTGALNFGVGHSSSNGTNNQPAEPWAPDRSDDNRGVGAMGGFLQCFELDPAKVTVTYSGN